MDLTLVYKMDYSAGMHLCSLMCTHLKPEPVCGCSKQLYTYSMHVRKSSEMIKYLHLCGPKCFVNEK